MADVRAQMVVVLMNVAAADNIGVVQFIMHMIIIATTTPSSFFFLLHHVFFSGTPHDIAVIQQPSLPPYHSFLTVAWGLVCNFSHFARNSAPRFARNSAPMTFQQVSDVDLESERFRYLGDLRLDVAAVSSIISRKTYNCTIQVE